MSDDDLEGDPSELDDLDDLGDDADDTRECPDCAETIKARARVCRFCGWSAAGPQRGRAPKRARHRPLRTGGMDSAATQALVLGILSVVICGLLAPFAVRAATESYRLARAARVRPPGTATAGLVLGWIGVAWLIVVVLLVVGFS